MRLAKFIEENLDEIIEEWEDFAKTIPVAKMRRAALRDHVIEILGFIVKDMETYQNLSDQKKKSRGVLSTTNESGAKIYAELRSESGFDVAQLASEYRALRASIIKLWLQDRDKIEPADIFDLIRFNESIDQVLMESIIRFKEKVEDSRDILIRILDYDMHVTIKAVLKSGELLLQKSNLTNEQVILASKIITNIKLIKNIIADLIALVRINIGTGLCPKKQVINIGNESKQIIKKIQDMHPDRIIYFETKGNLKGSLDRNYILQLFENLIENAILQSFEDSPVTVTVDGLKPEEIIISFKYEAEQILKKDLSAVFDTLSSMVRNGDEFRLIISELGLYIAKEIVIAHGGRVKVNSKKNATVFTIHLPREHDVSRALR